MNNPDLFARRPWFDAPVKLPHKPVGMLGMKEASLYYYLTRDAFSGRGTIVDAGSFLGRGGYYLAQGLRDNPIYVAGLHRVHCFDNFIVNEANTVTFIKSYLGRRLAIGDSTRDLFNAQVAPVLDMLDVHSGDFHTATWPAEPIEILMVDIAKSQGLGRRVVEIFFPHLIPGESIVIQQDYHHPWLPHIHVVMEYLADYFELVVPRADDTAVFRYRAAIPSDVLERAIRYDFTGAEQIELMNRATQRLPPDDRFIVELAGLVLRSGVDNHPSVATALEELHRRFHEQPRDYPQNSYFDDVSFHLKKLDAWRLYSAGDFAGARQLADEIVAHGRTAHSLLLRGMTLSGLRRDADAERDFRFAQQVGPPLGYCHVELAKVLLRQNRLDEAEAQLLTALRDTTLMDASTRDYLEVLYLIWAAKGTPHEEQTTMAELLERLPSDPEVWLLDGRLHQLLGDSETASKSWRRATNLGLPDYRLNEAVGVQASDLRNTDSNLTWQRVTQSASRTPVKSLLSANEREYLTWLTEEKYEGWGAIVELGAWLGSSSTCLAEGLRRRGLTTKIHTFDRFEWETNVSHVAGFDLEPGADFLPLYLESIRDYASWIDVTKTDLMGYVWEGGPIEILFIDCAKTWELTSSVLRGFGHALVPGRSRVVLEDFRYPWAHCLPLIFDSRPDVWKQLEDLENSTTVTFVPLKPLFGPCGLHENYSEEAFPFEAARELLTARIDREHGRNRLRMRWTLYRKCLIDGPLDEVVAMRKDVMSEGVDEDFRFAEEVEHILHERGWAAFQQGDFERAKNCAERCMVPPGPKSIYALTLLGFALCRLGDRQRAVEIATELLDRVPGFPSAKMLRGEIALAEGRHAAAEKESLEVLRSTPSDEVIIAWCLNTLLASWNRDPRRTSRANVLKEFETSLGASPAFRSHMAREQALAARGADYTSAPR